MGGRLYKCIICKRSLFGAAEGVSSSLDCGKEVGELALLVPFDLEATLP